MKFSTSTRYGLRAITYIAQKNEVCSIAKISEAEQISFTYLEKIISKLVKSKLLKVKHGAKGGYILSKDPQNITVEDVVNVLEKNISLTPCIDKKYKCPRQKICSTKNMWKKIDEKIGLVLKKITIKGLIS